MDLAPEMENDGFRRSGLEMKECSKPLTSNKNLYTVVGVDSFQSFYCSVFSFPYC